MDMQSKAKKLIEMIQTAPVEWKPLGEVAEIGTGSSNRQDEEHDGEYPFYVRSKNILRSSTYQFNETAIIIPGEGGIGDIFHYAEGKYALHQRAYRVHVVIPDLSPKFLYYFMNVDFKRYIQAKSVGATATSIRKPMLQRFPIPIPPLETQQKIVKILDKFTELEAELALRKRQYRYYRDFLLDFDNQIGGGIADGYKGRLKDVVWKTLGEVFDLKNGYTPSKSNKEYWENGSIPWFRMEDIRENSRILDNSLKHISKSAVKGGKLFPAKSIMMSTTATIGEHALIKVNYISNQQLTNFTIKDEFKDALDINFAFYYFFIIAEQSKKLINTSSLPIISMKELKKLKIPIPPLPEQEKIAAILDKFDTLTHSISEGLPHEIALRRKQYEYYREQLLAFPKAT
ncbi:TPA: restriction endonuclease subunit S [Neisseria meningitidis]